MMKKKLFGEFLVEKGVVSNELLLDALLEQLRGMQTLPEFAFRNAQLPPEAILAAFRLQQFEGIDFTQALRKAANIPPEKFTSLLESYAASRTPVGELLVKRGVPLETIIQAFDEFLNEYASSPPAPAPIAAALDIAQSPPAGKLQDPDSRLVLKEYLDLSGGIERRDRILLQLHSLLNCSDEIPESARKELSECTKFLRLLMGGARFLRLEKSETLLREIDAALLRLSNARGSLRPKLAEELHDALVGAVRQVWEYQESLANNGCESDLETGGIVSIMQKLRNEVPEPQGVSA